MLCQLYLSQKAVLATSEVLEFLLLLSCVHLSLQFVSCLFLL